MAMQIIQIEIAGAPYTCCPGAIVKKIIFDLGIDRPSWVWYTQFIK